MNGKMLAAEMSALILLRIGNHRTGAKRIARARRRPRYRVHARSTIASRTFTSPMTS
jgi:hypothetical protein